MAIREEFPFPGSDYMGGSSNGWEYRTTFGGTTLEQNYKMLRQFLQEEGYGDLPLPANIDELVRFRYPMREKQITMFEDSGYVHNPIKILFFPGRRDAHKLILCIYNEQAPNHLLRFHGIPI